MSRSDEFDFEPHLGRLRSGGDGRAGKPVSFRQQVNRAIARAGGDPRRAGFGSRGSKRAKSGRFNARGRGAKVMASLPRESGWQSDEYGIRFRARRVVVKARVVKLRGGGSKAAYAHLRYLSRGGVTEEGERGRVYGAHENEIDVDKFLDRGSEDRHQFRLIVAPEDSIELGDLRSVTRALMADMERDLKTDLDWVAVDHHNTGHPHTHIVIRGVTDEGKTLNIAGDYIAYGIRHRASELVTLALGPQTELEVQEKLTREVDQERFTRLDKALLNEVGEDGLLDLRMGEAQTYLARVNRHLMIDRLKRLERMGLAEEAQPARWSLSPDLEKTLRAIGEREDIIKTMHRAITSYGLSRSPAQYLIHRGPEEETLSVGKVIAKGLAGEELGERIHLVIDGMDGRVHYAEVAAESAEAIRRGSIVELGRAEAKPRAADHNIAAMARQDHGIYNPVAHLSIAQESIKVPNNDYEGYVVAHLRRLEALRRAGIVERLGNESWVIPDDFEQRARDYDTRRSKDLGVRALSTIDLETQVKTNGVTWLDREIVAGYPTPCIDHGFGREVRRALGWRQQWLIGQELMERQGNDVVFSKNLLGQLARREVRERGEKLAEQLGKDFRLSHDGERISGTYSKSVQLVSGKYALIERSRDFTLVPWRPVIEKELGRQISGLVRGDSISWELGRKRGLGIGM